MNFEVKLELEYVKLPHFFNQAELFYTFYPIIQYQSKLLAFLSFFRVFIHFSPLLTLQLLGICQILKGNELNSANSEREPTIVNKNTQTLNAIVFYKESTNLSKIKKQIIKSDIEL